MTGDRRPIPAAAPVDSARGATVPFARRDRSMGYPTEDTVNESEKWSPRLIALCMLGCLLFNYPILALFNLPGSVGGIPILYAYIFTVWALFIAMIALIVRRSG